MIDSVTNEWMHSPQCIHGIRAYNTVEWIHLLICMHCIWGNAFARVSRTSECIHCVRDTLYYNVVNEFTTFNTGKWEWIRMYIYIVSIYVYVRIPACIYIRIRTNTYTCKYMNACIDIYASMSYRKIRADIYLYLHCIDVCIHTNTCM